MENLRQYMAEALNHPLLSRHEEQELSEHIQLATAAYDLLRAQKITLEEYKELEIQAHLARERLIKANLRYVVAVARRYQHYHIPLEELVLDGNVGLMNAVEKFRPETGHRFSTYATFHISQAILVSIGQHNLIITPNFINDQLPALRQAIQILTCEGKEPTAENIAAYTGKTVRQIETLLQANASKQTCFSIERDNEEGKSSGELADVRNDTPYTNVEHKLDQQWVFSQMSALTPRETLILRMYYGIETGRRMTLRQVGDALGLTRERIRQIKHNAIEKLRGIFAELDV